MREGQVHAVDFDPDHTVGGGQVVGIPMIRGDHTGVRKRWNCVLKSPCDDIPLKFLAQRGKVGP